jgi:transposase-like protein
MIQATTATTTHSTFPKKKVARYPEEIKIEAVDLYFSKKYTRTQICQKLGIRSRYTLRDWISDYKPEASSDSKTTKSHNASPKKKLTWYSEEIKKKAVGLYLSKKYTRMQICQKFGIKSRYTLRDWIRDYKPEVSMYNESIMSNKDNTNNILNYKNSKTYDINNMTNEELKKALHEVELERDCKQGIIDFLKKELAQ